jgi:hypothetical protein
MTHFVFKCVQVKIWFQNRRMKWRNSKERELLSSGGSREATIPNKGNPHPDLSDVKDDGEEGREEGDVMEEEEEEGDRAAREEASLEQGRGEHTDASGPVAWSELSPVASPASSHPASPLGISTHDHVMMSQLHHHPMNMPPPFEHLQSHQLSMNSCTSDVDSDEEITVS